MLRSTNSRWFSGVAWGLVLTASAAATAAEPEAPGIVRISKPATTVRAQSDGFIVRPVSQQTIAPVPETVAVPANTCPNGDCWGFDDGKYGKSHGYYSDGFLDYFKCKFGYFFPTGCGGAGCPPVGKYARVYPQNPNYFDQRDGQVWAAQGYGVPIAVPLAPVVGHQYNYSWGTPASRLTPISRVAPY